MASKRNRLSIHPVQVVALCWFCWLCACRANVSGGQHAVPDDLVQADARDVRGPEVEQRAAGVVGGDSREPGPPDPADGVDELPRLHGQRAAELRAEFGEPDSKREFAMADCCTEFEIELYNTYPPNSGHDEVKIREWTWKYGGYALTVWLHKQGDNWRVLDTCRYGNDVEF
ncbi:MAG TPA: hypothetical protein ENJ18_01500 [Nannocystis exedens]|nr:hypothetical protein [Nannocystis exedens]